MIAVLASDYTDQAQVTNWPARIGLVVIVVALIVLALWGMRRGWVNRQRRQDSIPAPAAEPMSAQAMGEPVEGLFIGTAMAGDWMDRIAVHDLGVRSRAAISWGAEGIWLNRVGARSVLIPAGAIEGIRLDRGVAGTVKAKDSVIIITWCLGDALVDTGFRAEDSAGHGTVWDGLTAAFGLSEAGAGSEETGEPRNA